MKVYLLRHADAAFGMADFDRPLTPKGEEQIQTLAQLLKDNTKIKIEQIWHSPLKRAVQTASQFAQAMALNCPIEETDGLQSADDVRPLPPLLAKQNKNTLIVGHNPHLEYLATLMLKNNANTPMLIFKKAGLICLEYTASSSQPWLLRWYLTPQLF